MTTPPTFDMESVTAATPDTRLRQMFCAWCDQSLLQVKRGNNCSAFERPQGMRCAWREHFRKMRVLGEQRPPVEGPR